MESRARVNSFHSSWSVDSVYSARGALTYLSNALRCACISPHSHGSLCAKTAARAYVKRRVARKLALLAATAEHSTGNAEWQHAVSSERSHAAASTAQCGKPERERDRLVHVDVLVVGKAADKAHALLAFRRIRQLLVLAVELLVGVARHWVVGLPGGRRILAHDHGMRRPLWAACSHVLVLDAPCHGDLICINMNGHTCTTAHTFIHSYTHTHTHTHTHGTQRTTPPDLRVG